MADLKIDKNGTKRFYKNGQIHREYGPAIEWFNGTKEWFKNGKRHREDGPVVEYSDGNKSWYKNGKRHREDGPAVEWHKNEWWYNDEEIKCNSTEEFIRLIKLKLFW